MKETHGQLTTHSSCTLSQLIHLPPTIKSVISLWSTVNWRSIITLLRINETLSVITTYSTLLGHTNKPLYLSLSRVCAVATTLASLLSLQLTFLHHISLLPRPAPHLQLFFYTLQDHLTTTCVHPNNRSSTEPLAFLPCSVFPPLLSSSTLIYQSSLHSTSRTVVAQCVTRTLVAGCRVAVPRERARARTREWRPALAQPSTPPPPRVWTASTSHTSPPCLIPCCPR